MSATSHLAGRAGRAEDGITKNCFLVLQRVTPFVASIRDLGQLDTAISSAGIRELPMFH